MILHINGSEIWLDFIHGSCAPPAKNLAISLGTMQEIMTFRKEQMEVVRAIEVAPSGPAAVVPSGNVF